MDDPDEHYKVTSWTRESETAAVRLADTFGRYIRHKDDWQRQNELWAEMLTLQEVHVAERAASATQRLRLLAPPTEGTPDA